MLPLRRYHFTCRHFNLNFIFRCRGCCLNKKEHTQNNKSTNRTQRNGLKWDIKKP